jgi:hypothetical protein
MIRTATRFCSSRFSHSDLGNRQAEVGSKQSNPPRRAIYPHHPNRARERFPHDNGGSKQHRAPCAVKIHCCLRGMLFVSSGTRGCRTVMIAILFGPADTPALGCSAMAYRLLLERGLRGRQAHPPVIAVTRPMAQPVAPMDRVTDFSWRHGQRPSRRQRYSCRSWD